MEPDATSPNIPLTKAEKIQQDLEFWCWERLPDAIRACLKPPRGTVLLSRVFEDKADEWYSYLTLMGLIERGNTKSFTIEVDGETVATDCWCDTERLWEYINKTPAWIAKTDAEKAA